MGTQTVGPSATRGVWCPSSLLAEARKGDQPVAQVARSHSGLLSSVSLGG